MALYKAALREELWTPLNPSVSKSLETYFRERQEQGGHLGDPSDRYIAQEFRKQGMPKIQPSIGHGDEQGDKVLWQSSSTCLRDDWSYGRSAVRGSAAEPPVPPAHRLDGPRCVGQEGGQAKIASGWPPGFDTLSGRSLTPGGSVNANRCASVCIAAPCREHDDRGGALCRRHCRVSVSQSVNQRWRERPRCPALRLTPGALETGSFTPSLVVSHVAVCAPVRAGERAARVPVFVSRFAAKKSGRGNRTEIGSRACPCSPGRRCHVLRSRSSRRTIAPLMLAPCSASSMLFASLRPGRRPGLRALTTPPRGTRWAIARWWAAVDHSNDG